MPRLVAKTDPDKRITVPKAPKKRAARAVPPEDKRCIAIAPGSTRLAMQTHWMQTASGAAFDLTAQDHTQVSIRDIAAQLAKQCCFAGATIHHYSVAQRCVIVSQAPLLKKLGPLAELHGLLHDAHKAYTGNVPRPVKELLRAVLPYDALGDIERTVQRTIEAALRIPEADEKIAAAVKAAGEAALATELRDVMAEPQREWGLEAEPFKSAILPVTWARAEERFLNRYHDLTIAAAIGLGAAL